MFPYDAALLAAVRMPPQSIADVLQTMQTIGDICIDGDGLKWFNWLYLQVTQSVETRIASGGFNDPAWLAELDVQFARLYFGALESALQDQSSPGCWQVLFERRNQAAVARIQFALAGINAHINHDLPQAIVATCQVIAANPQYSGTEYHLLGDPLPPVSHLEDTIAAWSVSAAREAAWQNAEVLWHLRAVPPLSATFMDTLDGLTTVAGKALLVPVP
jgi:uncharacterized protein DUF5995